MSPMVIIVIIILRKVWNYFFNIRTLCCTKTERSVTVYLLTHWSVCVCVCMYVCVCVCVYVCVPYPFILSFPYTPTPWSTIFINLLIILHFSLFKVMYLYLVGFFALKVLYKFCSANFFLHFSLLYLELETISIKKKSKWKM